jgi:hypothetical protein
LVISDIGTGAQTLVELGTGLNSTSVASIQVIASGENYDQLATGTVFNPPTAAVTAIATPIISGGAITGITGLIGAGYYTSAPTVIITGNGTGASATALIAGIGAVINVSVSSGALSAITVVQGGSGYINGTYTAVPVNSLFGGTAGSGATVNIIVTGGIVTTVVINSGGVGYLSGTYTDVFLSTFLNTTSALTFDSGAVIGVTGLPSGTGYTTASIAFGAPANPPNPTPAVVSFTVPANIFGTNANLYYQVWAGTVCNSVISSQLNSIITYFQSLGYTTTLQTNPATGTSLEWVICW